jgi:TRAP-type uncharacterized transport system fused permease subunit
MTPLMPDAVYTIWTVGLVVTLVVWVPLAVYALHRTWRAACSIRTYANETLEAARGIVHNTASIAALGATIGVATDMVTTADAVEQKLGAIADLLASRAK